MTTPQALLEKYWGYPEFRPLQGEIVESVLAGRDTLALLPTGGGKSLCFQLPALALEGVTLVVSPLIALMKDQVRQLRGRGIVADAIYSGMRRSDIDRVLDNAVYGNTKLLYLSPERLLTDLARARIQRMPLAQIAVDEAHCISQWGYDFRPPYLRIAELRDLHPDVPITAVTATATPEVVADIRQKLKFGPGAGVFQQSFARDNLVYLVRQPAGKLDQLVDILKGVRGSSIVYVRSRGLTKELAHRLGQRGIAAAAYHAGLDTQEKDLRQEQWIKGELRVMVATNAFGMGIDKPDVRTVIHYGPPDSPEAYFQEAGRGGRDGAVSYAAMLYSEADGERLRRQHDYAYPAVAEIKRMYRALGSYLQLAVGGGQGESFAFDLPRFASNFGFDLRQAYSGLKALERNGYIVLTDDLRQAAELQFVVGKQLLYDYQMKHPRTDKLIKAILRTAQGAFTHPVQLREGALANFLQISTEELQRMLHIMHADGVVDYTPERQGPQLVFTEQRIDPDALRIDVKQYDFLRQRAQHRVDTMITYCAQDEWCRSQQLLRYFGEKDAPVCGRCDVCRRTYARLPDQRTIRDTIAQALAQGKVLPIDELVLLHGRQSAPTVAAVIQDLINEGLLLREETTVRLP